MATKTVYNYNQGHTVAVNSRWWGDDIASEERYQHVWGVVMGIVERQSYRSLNNLRYARLYGNSDILGLDAGRYARESQKGKGQRVTLNVIKSCVDTVTSKIGKAKPRPFFLTEQGNWALQQRAQKLTRFMDGWFDQTKTYAKGRRVFADGGILGTGALKIFRERDQVQTERVLAEEIIVDDVEGVYGAPRQLHQKRNVFKEVLAASFPAFRAKIMDAKTDIKGDASSTADMITVVESWHLRSGEDAKDGRHALSIMNATLIDEEYKKDWFPFSFYRWSEPVLGFYGAGLSEELIGIQLEINKTLRNIQIASNLVAVPRVWVESGTQVPTINNQIGGISKYVGAPPIFETARGMGPETYQHLENLWQKAFAVTGISAMSARSEKPAGVTAAVAINALSDMESERFMATSMAFEDFYLDVSEKALELTADIYRGDDSNAPVHNLSISTESKEFMESIAWKDVDIAKEKYVMRIFPTGILPSTPVGKLQKVQELMQAGMFSKEESLSLLDFPDLKAVTSRITAPADIVMKLIGEMLDKGKYFAPEPFLNLELAKTLTQGEYIKAMVNDCPADRLEMLNRFMEECDDLLDRAVEEAQAKAQEQAMAAQAAAAPAPDAMAAAMPGAMPEDPSMQSEGDPMSALGVPAPAPENELMPIAGETV